MGISHNFFSYGRLCDFFLFCMIIAVIASVIDVIGYPGIPVDVVSVVSGSGVWVCVSGWLHVRVSQSSIHVSPRL